MSSASNYKPTRAEVAAAVGGTLPDILAPGLRLLWCGINPGLYSAAVGHHYARPGNRFWKTLHAGGFTDRVWSPAEGHRLPEIGMGLTNLVNRATASADELSPAELIEGADRLRAKIERYQPEALAVLGIGAYRTGFGRRSATLGLQPEPIGGARVWVLPSPSGLNAHYQAAELATLFARVWESTRPDPPARR